MLVQKLISVASTSLLSVMETYYGIEINPRAVEFLSHYFIGDKKPMTLLPEEIGELKENLIEFLCHPWGWQDMKPNWYWALGANMALDEWGNYVYNNHFCWWQSTTGVVGGYIYEVVSWEDEFKCVAHDTFDFNPGEYWIASPDYWQHFPPALKRVITSLLSRWSIDYYESGGVLYVNEGSLAKLNAKHSFETTWEFTLPEGLSCPLSYGMSWDLEEDMAIYSEY